MKLDNKIIAEKMIGNEPFIKKIISSKTDIDLMTALNWYSCMADESSISKWITEYMKKNGYSKQQISAVQDTDFTSAKRVTGSLCRMINLGTEFVEEVDLLFKNRMKDLLNMSIKPEPEEKTEKTTSIQDRIKSVANGYINELDDEIATWFQDQKKKIVFSTYDFCQKHQLNTHVISHIRKFLIEKIVSEFEEFMTGKDEQLNEAYGYLKAPRKKEISAKLKEVIDDLDRYVGNTKAAKPKGVRKKKSVPVEKQINSLKYQKEYTKLKIKSIDPQNVIGAQSLWVYNTKYNQLTHYVADGPKGLSIKGTTLQNYNEEQSIKKKIRKPEETIPKVLDGGKIVLKKIMDEISTKPIEVNGRINEDTILLRALK